MRYNTKIYGHRGASLYASENSMEAFQLAYDMGADGIEFDVQMTKDGYLMAGDI
jgi:glycerophosphoryl diester phosphodiesterase